MYAGIGGEHFLPPHHLISLICIFNVYDDDFSVYLPGYSVMKITEAKS
jgi:hypothetical protein